MKLLTPAPLPDLTTIRASSSPVGYAASNPYSDLLIVDRGMNSGSFNIRWRSVTTDLDVMDLGSTPIGNILITESGDVFYNQSMSSTRGISTHGTGKNYTTQTNATVGYNNVGAAIALFEGRVENGDQTLFRWVFGSTATNPIVGRRNATLQKVTAKTDGEDWIVEPISGIAGNISPANFGHHGGMIMVFHNRYMVVCGPVDTITVYDLDNNYAVVDTTTVKPSATTDQKKTVMATKVTADSFIATMDMTIGQSTYYYGVSQSGMLISKTVTNPDVYTGEGTSDALPAGAPPIVYGFGPNKDHAIVITTGRRTSTTSVSIRAAIYKVTPTELIRRKFTSGYFSDQFSNSGAWPGRGGFIIPTPDGNGYHMTSLNVYDYGYRIIDFSML